MKLRNKETGEIIDIKGALRDSDDYPNHYLISAEWEDYEEPKVGCIIDPIEEDYVSADLGYSEPAIERAKELGIWFETPEEAEKAVEKLKAWKRLKNKGFKWLWYSSTPDGNSAEFHIYDWDKEADKDIKLLFRGEK